MFLDLQFLSLLLCSCFNEKHDLYSYTTHATQKLDKKRQELIEMEKQQRQQEESERARRQVWNCMVTLKYSIQIFSYFFFL